MTLSHLEACALKRLYHVGRYQPDSGRRIFRALQRKKLAKPDGEAYRLTLAGLTAARGLW